MRLALGIILCAALSTEAFAQSRMQEIARKLEAEKREEARQQEAHNARLYEERQQSSAPDMAAVASNMRAAGVPDDQIDAALQAMADSMAGGTQSGAGVAEPIAQSVPSQDFSAPGMDGLSAPLPVVDDKTQSGTAVRDCLTEYGLLIHDQVDQVDESLTAGAYPHPIGAFACPMAELLIEARNYRSPDSDYTNLAYSSQNINFDQNFWMKSYSVLNYFLGGAPFRTDEGLRYWSVWRTEWPVAPEERGTVVEPEKRVAVTEAQISNNLEGVFGREYIVRTSCNLVQGRVSEALKDKPVGPACRSILHANGLYSGYDDDEEER